MHNQFQQKRVEYQIQKEMSTSKYHNDAYSEQQANNQKKQIYGASPNYNIISNPPLDQQQNAFSSDHQKKFEFQQYNNLPQQQQQSNNVNTFKNNSMHNGSMNHIETGTNSTINKISDNKAQLERSNGCLLGAFLGDTMGSYLEFYKNQITEQVLQQAFTLPGGGIHKIAPGQLTDDGELAIMLAIGILKCEEFEINSILINVLRQYHFWCNSNPFDFGLTMQDSWNPIMFKSWESLINYYGNEQKIKDAVQQHVNKVSSTSQSNGFLMKQAPLGIFLWKQPKETIFEFAKQETLLTHSNQYCIDVSKLYVYTLSQLILRGRTDQFQIYAEIRSFAWKDQEFCVQTKENFISVEKCFEGITENSLSQGKKPKLTTKKMPNFNVDKIGWVQIAFSYCLYLLLDENAQFEGVFKGILQAGGDTDTNLCIVGAVFGALRGEQAFPKQLVNIIQQCDPTLSNQKRDKLFAPKNYLQLSTQLFQKGDHMKISSPKKNNSQLFNSFIQENNLIEGQNKKQLIKQEIKYIKNCNIDLLENCKIGKIENCLIKMLKNCKIDILQQSRLGEAEGNRIGEISHCIIQDTEMNIQKKNNQIIKKADIKFGILLL